MTAKIHKTLVSAMVAVAIIPALTGCHIYNKFDMSKQAGDDALLQEYVKAADQTAAEGAIGTLTWQTVYTDPVLQGYIQRALENNIDLENARLNIEVAHANMQGARMSYLPSVAISPNAAAASYDHAPFAKTYTIPLVLNWEFDIFGKILRGLLFPV